jgi:hypothetical protein
MGAKNKRQLELIVLAQVHSGSLVGIDAHAVDVEIDAYLGLFRKYHIDFTEIN